MSEDKPLLNEEERRKIEEQRVLIENVQKEYAKLDKADPRFIGIDLDNGEYWIHGHNWKIKKLGFTSQGIIGEMFSRHDALVVQHDSLPLEGNETKRIDIVKDRNDLQREIVETCIPMVLLEKDGKTFNSKKWFGDEIDGAVWWDCIRDCYLFLRGKGSREDILTSMLLSSSASQTTSNTTKTQTK